MEVYLGGLTAAITGLTAVVGVLWKHLLKQIAKTEQVTADRLKFLEERLDICDEDRKELHKEIDLLKGV